jgi:hypothetical protein
VFKTVEVTMRQRLAPAAPLLLALAAGCGWAHNDWHDTDPTSPTAAIVGSGHFVSDVRPLDAVNRIVASGALPAIVTLAATESLEITAEDNILPLLDCGVRSGTLSLAWKPNTGGVSSHGITIRVGLRELIAADLSGASSMAVDALATPHFDLSMSGAARFNGFGLTAHTLNANVSGASTATIRALDRLTATVSGASTLEFYGDPVVDARVSDTSMVRRIGP